MTDLGTVGTDPCSTAYAASSQGQVVGNSGDGSGSGACGPKLHGFLSANGGPAVDLDTLYAPLASGLHFSGACCISESGEILGFGFLANGDTHALLMIPCDAKHPDNPDCHTSPADIAATGTIAGNPAPGANLPLAGDMMRKISPYITHPW